MSASQSGPLLNTKDSLYNPRTLLSDVTPTALAYTGDPVDRELPRRVLAA